MPCISEEDSWLVKVNVKCPVFERLPWNINKLNISHLDYDGIISQWIPIKKQCIFWHVCITFKMVVFCYDKME